MKCRDAPRRDALRRRSRPDSDTRSRERRATKSRSRSTFFFQTNERSSHASCRFLPRRLCDTLLVEDFTNFSKKLPQNNEAMSSSNSGTMCAIALAMLAVTSTCQGAPSFRPKPEWRDDGEEAPAILTSNCDPVTGRCWEWLPLGDTRLDEYAVEQDAAEFNRGQPIHARDVDQAPWRDTAPVYGRLAKKDVFTSRGWGAGGMPFSVLYMSPRANHPAPGTAQAKAHKSSDITRKSEDSSSPPLPVASAQHQPPQQQQQQSNYRVSLRNGIHGTQPRRHYSIIPQLFISYGWGPSGK